MNFDFDDEQYSFRDTLARFLGEKFPLDKHEKLVGAGRDHEGYWAGLAELGLFCLLVPEDQGGIGLSFIDLALPVEELGKAIAPLSIADTLAATDLLARFGTDAQKAKYLPGIATGELRASIAYLEAGAGYDPGSVAATRGADGKLSGAKILAAHAADANLLLVAVKGAVLVLDRDTPGLTLAPHGDIDPASGFQSVALDGVVAGDDTVLGGGADAVARLFDAGATLAAGMLVGLSDRVFNVALDYMKTRVQFDRPIGSFQALKHRSADIKISLEAACAATYYAFWAMAEDAPDRARAVSIAKAYAGDVARRAANEGIQFHGGMGFTWELGIHHYLRRVKVLEAAYGDATFHRERVFAETLASLGGQAA